MYNTIDIIYKISRLLLPLPFFTLLKKRFGRANSFNSISYYENIVTFYCRPGIDLSGKQILELGGGNQYYTAALFFKKGAQKVILVEPAIENFNEKEYSDAFLYINRRSPKAYEIPLIFSSLKEIPVGFSNKIDYIFSHTVLEHFSSLDIFFSEVTRLLHKSGLSRNRIDLSDHTLHCLDKYFRGISSKNALKHLQYSDRFFSFLNDKKCFINRRLLAEYKSLAIKHKLNALFYPVSTYQNPLKVHNDIKIKYPFCEEDMKVIVFDMELNIS